MGLSLPIGSNRLIFTASMAVSNRIQTQPIGPCEFQGVYPSKPTRFHDTLVQAMTLKQGFTTLAAELHLGSYWEGPTMGHSVESETGHSGVVFKWTTNQNHTKDMPGHIPGAWYPIYPREVVFFPHQLNETERYIQVTAGHKVRVLQHIRPYFVGTFPYHLVI